MNTQSHTSLLWTTVILSMIYGVISLILLTAGITQTPVDFSDSVFIPTTSSVTIPTLFSTAETLVEGFAGFLVAGVYILPAAVACISNIGIRETTTGSSIGMAAYIIFGILVPSVIALIAQPIAATLGGGASAEVFAFHAKVMHGSAVIVCGLLLTPLIVGTILEIKRPKED